ncbi:MAG: 50S ribosomal protein L32 [Chloroflexi bacterium]|nr:50S ribosomal protein L32 [Chloroflexota bacterium]
MGALPKKKVSRARRGSRRAHTHLATPTLMNCPQCGARKMTHHVCPTCGTYNGNQVLRIEDKPREAN